MNTIRTTIITVSLFLMTASTAFGFLKDAENFEMKFHPYAISFMQWALTTNKTVVDGKPTQKQIDMFKKEMGLKHLLMNDNSSYYDSRISCFANKSPKTCKISQKVESGIEDYNSINVIAERDVTLSEINSMLEIAKPIIESDKNESGIDIAVSKRFNELKKLNCEYELKAEFFIVYSSSECHIRDLTSKASIDSHIIKHTIDRALNPEIYSKQQGRKSIRVHSSSVHLTSKTRPGFDYEKLKNYRQSIGIR